MRLVDGRGRAGLDGADLLECPVLVLGALDEERGDAPAADRILDVPGLEAGVEPGVVPAAEGDVDMGVIFGEPRPQIAGLVGAPASAIEARPIASVNRCGAIRTRPLIRSSGCSPA